MIRSAIGLSITLFAANIAADTIYHGLADGNPDLFQSNR